MRIAPRRRWVALAAAALVVVTLAMGSASAAGPAEIGAWSAPFEEGGAAVPRCATVDGRIVCKPTAVGAAVLRDGRVLYMNGIESGENVQYAGVPEAGVESRNSLSRILDLRGQAPAFTIPSPETGDASNPNIRPEQDPFGVLGVPGRPGDGLAGTLWGTLGGPEQNPTSPPDDPEQNDGDLFCTDMSQLADGRILIAGGTDWYDEPRVADRSSGAPMAVGVSELEGLRSAQIFDPASGTYRAVQPMKYGRWYPGTVTMPDGKVFVASGVTKLIKSTQGSQVRRPELFDPATATWADLGPQAENSLPLFPRLHLMPNGKVFYAGVGQQFGPMGQAGDELLWILQQFFDPATKTWETVGPAQLGATGGAPQVMLAMDPPYDRAQLLIPGGTPLLPSPGSWLASNLTQLITVDSQGNVTQELKGNLNNRRWYSSAVTLPDGKVFLTSGADKDEVVSPGFEFPVRQPELYDPATGEWTAMAESSRDRTYHNSALLLPDGRVLVGGHSPIWTGYGATHDAVPGVTANNDKDSSFEVWSPPYLFRGDRPILAQVQKGIQWGTSFQITTPNAADISKVVLSRLPSPQHITDSDSRTLRLNFTRNGALLDATAPPNGIAAPPGYYYLFILNGDGVPSVARIVHVGDTTDLASTTPIYTSGDVNNPAAPSGTATEPEDSSYLAKPPPPLGAMAVGMVAMGVALPARRRRREEDEAA
jgi:galactose oxidase-like protein